VEHRKLRVLIVSAVGAHQKAIQAVCASEPQIMGIDSATKTQQAFEMVRYNPPDLVILGVNIPESRVCELLSQIRTLPEPPYCVALTVSEFGTCLDQSVGADQIIPTATFADRLPEILNQVFAK
jgi:CheY-like chemotaxis protein